MTTKESMMKNQVFVSILMNKLAIIPIFFLTMCGTAPITDPPAHACSLPLDGSPANCPDKLDDRDLIMIPRQELKGEVDIYNPDHWVQMQMMFQRNLRKCQIEINATLPSDAINNALDNFWEQKDGSNGSTESEELL